MNNQPQGPPQGQNGQGYGPPQGQYNGQQGYNGPQGGPGYGPPQGQYQQHYQQQPPPKKNWFLRHKFLTALLALVVIILLVTATKGGSGSSNSGSSGSGASANASGKSSGKSTGSDSSGDSSQGASAAPAPVGTPVRDGKFEFTVTKVERGKKTVGAQYLEQSAQGEFTLVYVTVKNIGTEQQGLSDSDQKAFDTDGTQYSADSGVDASIEQNNVLFTQINPGNQVKGVIAFDAPVGKKLTRLELHDSMFSGGVSASL